MLQIRFSGCDSIIGLAKAYVCQNRPMTNGDKTRSLLTIQQQ